MIEQTIDRLQKRTKVTIDRKPTAMLCLFDGLGMMVVGMFLGGSTTQPDGFQAIPVVAWTLHGS